MFQFNIISQRINAIYCLYSTNNAVKEMYLIHLIKKYVPHSFDKKVCTHFQYFNFKDITMLFVFYKLPSDKVVD